MENLQPSEITDEQDEQNDCWDMIEDDLKQQPPALEPIYVTNTINQSILLYDGPLAIEQNGRTVEGSGKVKFAWFPYSGVKYEFQGHNNGSLHPDADTQLKLVDYETSINIALSSVGISTEITASGTVSEAISIGSEQQLEYLLCHIVNFYDVTGSSVMEAENWTLTLGKLQSTTEHIKQLNCQSGFAITHVAKLERADGQTFTGTEAIQFLNLCSHFFSFARGFRIPVILLVGYNSTKERVWQHWDSRDGLSWKGVSSWFPNHENGVLTQLLPGFLKWWRSWDEDIVNTVLNLYLTSNINAAKLEGSIVLTQVALELIAWTLLVEQEKVISEVGFEKLPASDKIRLLLSKFNISTKLSPDWETSVPELYKLFGQQPPQPLQNLVAMDKNNGNKWVDGPHAFTEFRNGIVHPKRLRKILNAEPSATFEVCSLGRWYLELVLLALCGYQGKYVNRLLIPHQSPEFVPWI
jgi:hypothetical protein